ncbi:AsmA-like C-terminal region-containing protein [Mesorhizobium sp. ZMM04-5]|uniref:AsmA-like C-terminal region-containing protein n=1 Tax=Mesorhizobium marinum TaxID=3228790 RepID=A0ABV3QVJ1_9HYPH
MLARLFVIFGGLIVLALTAALVGPYFVDWSSYRADFEREASAILGRKVTVQGEATATILPFPSVTFSDVAVGGGAKGEPAMTAETFSMDAELAPLLSGEFRIFDMRLVRPKATIEVAADGAIDWAVRPSTPIDASQISIEKLTITEGQVVIHHASSGRTHRLTEINTEVSARSLAGPWRMVGSMRVDGLRSDMTVNTGRAAGDGIRLRIQAEPEVRKVAIETDGDLRFDDGATATYAGDFKIAARRDRASEAEPAPAEGPGFRVKGKFELDDQRLALDEFRFETGPLDNPYAADGNGFIDFGAAPRFALSVDGAQVRFDEAIGAGDAGSLTIAERFAALQEALLDLPKPSIPGTMDVNLPAVVAGDTTIREVSLSAEPQDGGWAVKSLAATLPGRTTLEAKGSLRTEGELGFKGSLLLAVAQPSGFAAWVAQDVDDAIRRLPAAGFRADVDLTRNHQAFDNLELGLGGATFRGRAERLQPSDARPATVLKLDGGALDLDGLAAFASLFVSDVGVNRFAEGDLDLDVRAGPVGASGLTAQSVDAALRLRDGLLEIDRLSIGDIAGATVSATGTIRDFPASPSGNLDVSVVAVDLAPLVAALADRYPASRLLNGLDARAAAYRGLLDDARLDVVATAAANGDGTTGFAASAQGSAGGTDLSATLSGSSRTGQVDDADVSVALSARNDDATELLALYGLPVLPLGLTGGGETEFSLKGKLSGDLATSLDLRAEDFLAGFAGVAKLGDGLAVRGHARLDAPDIEPWLMTAGVRLPAMGAGLPVELEANADYADGLLVLDALSGTLNQGAVSGDVNATLADGRPQLTGQLTLDELNLEPLAAMVVGEASLENGTGGWSSVPFAPSVSTPLTAELGITAATVTAGPAVTAYDASVALKLDGEGLRLSDLSARFHGGELTGLFELKNSGGTAYFSSQTRLAGADIRSLLGDAGLAGTGDISTALSASGKSVGGLVATLSGSGTAGFRSLVVDGVNPEALPELIARANRDGRDIDAARTAGFAPAIVSSGRFAAEPGEAAFTVAAGVLRAPPLKLTNHAADIEANVQSDFNRGEVSVSGTITYEPGQEALVGSEPALRFSLQGPLAEATRSLDSEPLAQFLTQRALEAEQRRVEGMQAALLEKQRLRREVRYYAALQLDHDRATEAWRKEQEEARKAAEAEAEARRKAEEEARLKAEAEERARQAEADRARLAAEEEARKAAEERARLAAEEAERQAAEATRLEAEAAARAEAEERARLEAEAAESRAAQERAQAEADAAKREAEAAAKAEADARARLEAQERVKRQADEAARAREQQIAPSPDANAETPPRPRTDVIRPTGQPPELQPGAIDGFMRMLQGN